LVEQCPQWVVEPKYYYYEQCRQWVVEPKYYYYYQTLMKSHSQENASPRY